MNDVKAETRIAKVVHVVDSDQARGPLQLVINRGDRYGVKVNDQSLIFGDGPHIADPDTGMDLGGLEIVRSQGDVVRVQDQIATVRSVKRWRTRRAKRTIRDPSRGSMSDYIGSGALGGGWSGKLGSFAGVIEEEVAPEAEVPFDSVQLGDLAKPI